MTLLVGLSHRTAPVEVRERHTIQAQDCAGCAAELKRVPELREVAILATCNRTELIAVAPEAAPAAERLRRFLREEVGDGSLRPEHLYDLRGSEAVGHLFRVAGSLDSMVLGEAQILGQVKQAYRAAEEADALGPVLHRLFQRAFRCAKQIRNRTGLGASTVSVARIGVQLAREIFETFDEKRVLLLGAGEMAESALAGLRDAGARQLSVANRSLDNARALADRFGGDAVGLDGLERELERADIAITSIAVREPPVTRAILERVMQGRHGRPLLLVDLGLPRNVEPSVNDLDNVYVYDIDDLEEVADRGRAARREAVGPALAIVEAEVERFERWLARLDVAPTIKELVDHASTLVRSEARRLARGSEADGLERAAAAVVAKLLHPALTRLRAEAEEGSAYYSVAVRDLFGLDADGNGNDEGDGNGGER